LPARRNQGGLKKFLVGRSVDALRILSSFVDRQEFLPCLYRDASGRVQEVPFPEGEPDRDKMTADLYCPYYGVKKGLFGPARITDAGISILNRRSYQRDEELVEIAGERLMSAILSKESREIIEASGGVEGIRSKIGADEFYG